MRRLALLLLAMAPPALGWGGPPDWVKIAAKTALPSYGADTAGVVLLSDSNVTVTGSGEIRVVSRRVLKILNTSGRELGAVAVHFSATTRLASLHAWSIGANGEEYEAGERDAMESGVYEGELYGDQRLKAITIPAAGPGSVVAYEWELRTAKPEALQDTWQFQESIPVRLARYTLVLPDGWSHEVRWFNRAAAAPRAAAGRTMWELSDVEAVKDEPRRPPMLAVAGRMAVNFVPPPPAVAVRSWDDAGRWYAQLVQDRRFATPALQAKTRELTADKSTTMEKIAALASFVQRDVRYVAIEIGIGGYQPHPAGDIFTNRYGDCKDKVTLLGAMLKEIGVESYYVMVSTERGVIDAAFPSVQGFDHAIIAIRLPAGETLQRPAVVDHPKLGRLLIFDPTSSSTPLGDLPLPLQKSPGLLVTAGGELLQLPGGGAETNELRRTAKMMLDGSGTLSGEVTESRRGAPASEMRALLATMTASERSRFIEHAVASSVGDFKVSNLSVENLDDLQEELVVRYSLRVPSYARKAGNLLLVRARVVGAKSETVTDLAARKSAYATEGPSVKSDDVEIAAPAGVAVEELPPPAKVDTRDIAYSSETKFDGGVLHYRRDYRVNTFEVPRAALPDLNKTLAAIVADERATAIFKLPPE